jgi:hypothetical protein
MAKFEIKFKDAWFETDFIKAEFLDYLNDEPENLILITSSSLGKENKIYLDKSTAIKFAKTLRTEINKITESEVNNG